ncbi:glycosyltransferase family 39 protein [Pseudomonas sp. HMWF006]|uniref:glycosyltransferase family 39 protein n=1 Tax=Pseudomonas sp. HMWF006 TaxID=2056843 RepID=UPI000D4013A5|nr:glycosyltransferase family 39 protein [Pseudomonas sp. HMWF006]PTT02744.1 hypothetical protein DBR24_06365 [Pseudomonas sp. HMWF006]PTT71872.1 hypothetical protein DBR26_06550 [Pseudomonas sp. HMWF007]
MPAFTQGSSNRGIESRWLMISSGLILLLSILLRFHDIGIPYLWTDEAFSALVSVQSPSAIWFHMGHEVHPPLYFLLLHLWIQMFGDSVQALRAMSAVAGVVAVALGMRLMRFISRPRLAVMTGLFMALLPISVRYSQEARMYSLEAVWLLGATLALVYWLRGARDRYLVIYALLVIAALYTHYLSILCVLAHFIYLIALRFQADRRLHVLTRAKLWIACLVVTVAYIPWLFSLTDEVIIHNEAFKTGGEIFWIPGLTAYTLPSALWRFFTLKARTELSTPVYLLLPLLVVALALWVACRDRSRLRLGLLLFIFSFFPVLAVFLVSFKLPIFIERYVAFSAIGVVMLLALAVARMARRTPMLAGAMVVLILGLECLGLNTMYTRQDDLNGTRNEIRYPLDQIVGSINERSRAGDTIVVNGGYWYYSVAYYSRRGIQPLLYQPAWDNTTDNRPNGYGSSTLIYPYRDQLFLEDLSALPRQFHRVWWVTSRDTDEQAETVPDNWECLLLQDAGELQLRLYVVQPESMVRQGAAFSRCQRL